MIRVLPFRNDPDHILQVAVLRIGQHIGWSQIDIIDPLCPGTFRKSAVGLANALNPVRRSPDVVGNAGLDRPYRVVPPSMLATLEQGRQRVMREAYGAERIVD